MTAPHIGNTGVNDEDAESRADLGRRLRRPRPGPRARPTGARGARLDDELRDQGVVGISGIDTRALTRHLRERGAMRVGIFSGDARPTPAALLARVRQAPGDGRAPTWPAEVTTDEPYVVAGDRRRSGSPSPRSTSASRRMTPHRMAERGIEVHVLPATATVEDVLAVEPGRRVLLQRPRRPGHRRPRGRADAGGAGRAGSPLFGICFGNQILGRALGFGTYKLKYGHRGINQPVHGPHHRQGRGHRAQPRLRRRRAARRVDRDRRSAASRSATSA